MFGLNGSEKLVGGWRLRRGFHYVASALCVVGLACGSGVARAASNDGKGAYKTGRYRNLFAEAGHSQVEIDAKIEAAYQQLFHGNPETQSLFFAAGENADGPLAYVTDWANHDVRTEGMSYAMMIAVQRNKKEEFDALWNWVMTHMYISDPAHPSYGYFSWSAKTSGEAREETPAPDGEEYFAMSLLFAANRWGSGAGIYDYLSQGERLLRAGGHREGKSGIMT